MNVYSRAAQYMANDEGYVEFSCHAIDDVQDAMYSDARKNYCQMFKPSLRTYDEAQWGDKWSESLFARRECRILALCFAAAMHETGDL